MAATWNYRPVTDDYTCMFSGHISEHVRDALAEGLEPDTAGAGRADGIAALRTVLRYGHGYDWGQVKLSTAATDPAVLRDPREFKKLVLGPFPAMGRHDLADPIPSALDQAAERTLAGIWETARTHAAAGDASGPAAANRSAEPAAAGA